MAEPQACIISGESGAGKTETAKYFLTHLLDLSRNENSGLLYEYDSIQFLLNELTEAFGNASTIRNQNSSRFGKYMSIFFDEENHVVNAKMAHYMLEKSRVAVQQSGERNYHVFYYVLEGIDDATLEALDLIRDHSSYNYLKGTPIFEERDRRQLAQAFQQLWGQMEEGGFTQEELDGIVATLALVLHIGNLEFVDSGDAGGKGTSFALRIKGPLSKVATQIGCSEVDLSNSLATNLIVMRGETIVIQNSIAAACDARDGMAKALYSRLFSWLINSANRLMSTGKKELIHPEREIGVLDVFGFEDLQHNSIEQMCINVANEQLQALFSEHVFGWQMRELEAEGVDIGAIS